MKYQVLASAVYSLLSCFAVGSVDLRVDEATSTFRDKNDRTLLFHGTNFVNKASPYYPTISENDIAELRAMGLNVVRLGVMMNGLFPESATANPGYISQIRSIINRLWSNGIYTIIDLHQDVLSKRICGEGLPDWMMNVSELDSLPFPMPLVLKNTTKADPTTGTFPGLKCDPVGLLKFIGWSEYYMTDASGKAWGQIYNGEGVLGQMFEVYWDVVSKELKGVDGVLAYEILNEPWMGDHVKDRGYLLRVEEQRRQLESL